MPVGFHVNNKSFEDAGKASVNITLSALGWKLLKLKNQAIECKIIQRREIVEIRSLTGTSLLSKATSSAGSSCQEIGTEQHLVYHLIAFEILHNAQMITQDFSLTFSTIPCYG